MNFSPSTNNVSFGYKVFVDSGASDRRRGSFKVSIRSEQTGKELFKTDQLPDSFKKVGPEDGFKSSDDYINGLSRCITKSIDMAKDAISQLNGKDKNLSGILINAPGYVVGGIKARMLVNLKDHNDKSLENVDFTKIAIDANKNSSYRVIATNDLHGTAAAAAKELKDQGRLKAGSHFEVYMVGGGIGAASFKVKNDILEIEGCEGGHEKYYSRESKTNQSLENVMSVPGLITNYCKNLNYPDSKTQKIIKNADARIVTNALNSDDKIKSTAAEFAIDTGIDALAQAFARKVVYGVNEIIVTGPLMKGIKEALTQKTGNPNELLDRLNSKIKEHVCEKGTGPIMAEIHDFKVNLDIDIPDNTVGAGILLDSSEFIGGNHRGNWINIPVNEI